MAAPDLPDALIALSALKRADRQAILARLNSDERARIDAMLKRGPKRTSKAAVGCSPGLAGELLKVLEAGALPPLAQHRLTELLYGAVGVEA